MGSYVAKHRQQKKGSRLCGNMRDPRTGDNFFKIEGVIGSYVAKHRQQKKKDPSFAQIGATLERETTF